MNVKLRTSLVVIAATGAGIAAWSQVRATAKPASYAAAVQPFLAKNCYACHNATLASGNLDLTQFKTAAAVAANRERFELLVRRLRGGEMPPAGLPRPNQTELLAATSWLDGEFSRLDAKAPVEPGRVTARRLNKAEYNNTVKDLLGVDFKPADDFPQDDSGYGFDNNGDVLSVSVVQMEKYLAAAEKVARTAIYGPQSVKPTMARFQPAGRRRPGDPDSLFFNTHPYMGVTNYDESGLSMPNSLHAMYHFPATGDYLLRATPDNGARPAGSDGLEIGFFIDGKPVGSKIVEGQLEGKTQEIKVRVTEGDHWVAAGFPRQFEGLPPIYGAKNPTKKPPPPAGGRGGGRGGSGRGGFGVGAAGGSGRGGRGVIQAGVPIPNGVAANADIQTVEFSPPGAPPGTRLARPDNMGLQSMEIGGPQNPEIHPSAESLKKIYICRERDAVCGKKILSSLGRLAFRRPLTAPEVDALMAQATRAAKRGDSFEEQLVLSIQAMLVSPKFLFRIEKDPKAGTRAPQTYALNDYELASRLSYFLWSSMPDEELLRVAGQGTLRQSAVLTTQVKRMLKDPKIARFVDNFGGQWLQIRELESHKPDFYKYSLFDEYMRMSMVKETQLFFGDIISEDRSIMDFLDADYTFVNEYLGQYYGLSDVKGPEFRKVSLAGTPRRGVLGHASVLTATSYPNRTSVVLRGKWILDNILNSPPPPPPPNVPDLEDAKTAADATLRERMDAHRNNPICASCHSKMDPLGFGLENYDAIGNWREKDGKTIDPSGLLPDGRKFRGPVELAAILKSDGGAFAQGLSEKMMIYALGRGLEPYDKLAIKKIAAALPGEGNRFSALVLAITKSVPFQMRSTAAAAGKDTKAAREPKKEEKKI